MTTNGNMADELTRELAASLTGKIAGDAAAIEIEQHADFHRRAAGTYESQVLAARRERSAAIIALTARKQERAEAYHAEIAGIDAEIEAARSEGDARIAKASRLAETSRAALAVLEREG